MTKEQEAKKHIGEAINNLQDSGWTNTELKPLERFYGDLNGK